jgi:hypothetical protein
MSCLPRVIEEKLGSSRFVSALSQFLCPNYTAGLLGQLLIALAPREHGENRRM